MNNNYLLDAQNVIFETHFFQDRKLPIIFNMNIQRVSAKRNVHDNLELYYAVEGKGCIICDSRKYEVSPGDIVVVNSYTEHQAVPYGGGMVFYHMIIDKDFCNYHNIDVFKLCFSEFIHDDELNELFMNIIEEAGSSEPFNITGAKCALLSLMLFLCRNYSCLRIEAFPDQRETFKYTRLAVEYIKKNIGKKLTVDMVADAVGLSRYHFSRVFKKTTGYTVVEFINYLRCERAKSLLVSGKYSVKEVAIECGFENNSYFSNVFRSHSGKLPSDYIGKVNKTQ